MNCEKVTVTYLYSNTFQVAVAYDELHPRTRAALLAVSNTALKTSVFKLENELSALLPWMEAAGMIKFR